MTSTDIGLRGAIGALVSTGGSAVIDRLPDVRELKTFLEEEFEKLPAAISEKINVKEFFEEEFTITRLSAAISEKINVNRLRTLVVEEFQRLSAAVSEKIRPDCYYYPGCYFCWRCCNSCVYFAGCGCWQGRCGAPRRGVIQVEPHSLAYESM